VRGVSALDYTVKRVHAFLDEIARLSESEFPYPDSKVALHILERMFRDDLIFLNQFDSDSDKDIIDQQCTLILRKLFIYLPILGFVLRSTNVRNPFEVFGPVLRLASDALEPNVDKKERKTRLILSSEWDYSPYVYHELPDLPNFALIGLPAPESSNPFLVPLSGHELGHLVWVKNTMKDYITPKVNQAIVSIMKDRWNEYLDAFPHPKIEPEDLETNILAIQHWVRSLGWALKQAEESFADFVGLRMFGISFLHAFAYLFSPKLSLFRSVNYPNMLTRVQNLIKAARAFEVEIPQDYQSLFKDSEEQTMTKADEFRLSIADKALGKVIDELLTKVNEILDSSGIKKPSKDEEQRIYERFRQVVPAENTESLPAILNAAWRAYEEQDFWKDIPQVSDKKDVTLKELVLKNIEVFEIEQILSEGE